MQAAGSPPRRVRFRPGQRGAGSGCGRCRARRPQWLAGEERVLAKSTCGVRIHVWVTPRVGVVTTSCTRENLGGEWARNILILGPRAGYVGLFGFQKSCSWVKRPSIFLRVHSTSQKPYFHTGFRPSLPLPHPMFTAVSAPILRPFHDLILKTNCFSVHFVRLCLLTFFFKY